MLLPLVGGGVAAKLKDGVATISPGELDLDVIDSTVGTKTLEEKKGNHIVPFKYSINEEILSRISRFPVLKVSNGEPIQHKIPPRAPDTCSDLVTVAFLPDEFPLLEFLGFSQSLMCPLLQDLQHIWRYPGLEQYRLSASIRQNTDRSARHRCPGERETDRFMAAGDGGTKPNNRIYQGSSGKLVLRRSGHKTEENRRILYHKWQRIQSECGLREDVFAVGWSVLDLDSH